MNFERIVYVETTRCVAQDFNGKHHKSNFAHDTICRAILYAVGVPGYRLCRFLTITVVTLSTCKWRIDMSTLTSLQLPTDDTISYKIYVAKAVPLTDVSVTAQLEMMVSNRDDNQDLDSRIFGALNDFIDTDWTLLEQKRSSATPGFERVSLKAMAKIPAKEDRKLEERAARANREGLEFGQIQVSRNLPQEQANQIIKELWFEAVEKATGHLDEFNRVSGRQWRLGDVTLGVPGGGRSSGRPIKGGYVDDADEPLGKFMESGLSGVEKVSLTADVTLRSARPTLESPCL